MQKFGSESPCDRIVTGYEPINSLGEMISRNSGYHITKDITVTGTGSQSVNLLQVTGTVLISNQWALITEVTTLTNLTGMYADLYDGTDSVALTGSGAVLSGLPVGTFFTKDMVSSEPFSVNSAAAGSVLETLITKKSGRPFTVTQKNGEDTFIRLHFTTTDEPVNFKIKIHFEYYPINGSTIAFL